MTTKSNNLIQVAIIYLAIALSGFITWKYFPMENEVLTFLVADVVMTIVCFIFSLIKKNSSVYDAFWSVIPFYFLLQWAFMYCQDLTFLHYLAFVVVSLWSWRLTLNWVRSWSGFAHEDWRYVNLAKQSGALYPVVNFLGIHLFPTAMVFAGMWPLFYLFQNPVMLDWLFYLGAVISLMGVAFEFFADNQLAQFRKRPNPKTEDLLDTGLWGRSRNPNYLGEMLFWLGVFLMGHSFGAPVYTIVGVGVMVSLFVFISIPMKEERMMERRANFADYKKRVPKLIPRLW
jgi:steroid 5-alpha reductase family enzyme